jgi:glycosyltransferase involved in cell wall biosynthesis
MARMKILMIGPDFELWEPSDVKTDEILWKGNGGQYVKGVNFGLEISRNLPQYKFNFIGHPKPYHYDGHIKRAKQAKLYICTSLSETMGLALAEQWAAGIPSVTHPQIYLHGENYKTGIITNRTVADYCEAIEEIMESPKLYQRLSKGAYEYARKNFSDDVIIANYEGIIGESLVKNE